MKSTRAYYTVRLLTLGLFLFSSAPFMAESAILYKNYIIRQDQGSDILCEPYTVRKNDSILKIFIQKGEIAPSDFPGFLGIFQRLNPGVQDINLIRPGQQIIIPLKKVTMNALPGQSSGLVTLPFVTISNAPDMLQPHTNQYQVKPGDYVAKLITNAFGAYGSREYHQGLKLFRFLNPDIKDINRIYVGQRVLLPDPSARNQSWYSSLFDVAGNLNVNITSSPARVPGSVPREPGPFPAEKKQPVSPLSSATAILDAKLLNQGAYYFPRPGRADLKLDLSRLPIIEFLSGKRILLARENTMEESDLQIVSSFWNDVKIIRFSNDESIENILNAFFQSYDPEASKYRLAFSDRGLEVKVQARWVVSRLADSGTKKRYTCITLIKNGRERTPDSVVRYLEQHGIFIADILLNFSANAPESAGLPGIFPDHPAVINSQEPAGFIKELLKAMSYPYTENVTIKFPYAGITVEALSNLVTRNDGSPLFLDFGNLYGEAVAAIKKAGMEIVQITKNDTPETTVNKLLGPLGEAFTQNPIFHAAQREPKYNTAIKAPGFLIQTQKATKIFLTPADLPAGIMQLLNAQGVKIMRDLSARKGDL
ncbi:MAG: hypothetical protein Q8P24_06880 [Desulfobacterales bacterium]|nr:hypothetical protein [Desulfobacterales bacterium]